MAEPDLRDTAFVISPDSPPRMWDETLEAYAERLVAGRWVVVIKGLAVPREEQR